MTYKEKLQLEHPEAVGGQYGWVGCKGCPSDYGYDEDDQCEDCWDCWHREVTESAPVGSVGTGGMGYGSPVTIIKDSGERREFASGAVRDMSEGKGRMDLLPWAAVMEVAKHCENGSRKYGAHNVDKGIPTSSLCDSAARHLAKYFDGWEDEPHLLAAAWNLLWAIQMEIKHPEMCDVPWKGDA